MADKTTLILLGALRRALAQPAGLPLHSTTMSNCFADTMVPRPATISLQPVNASVRSIKRPSFP